MITRSARTVLALLLLVPGVTACGAEEQVPPRALDSAAVLSPDAVEFDPEHMTVEAEDVPFVSGGALPEGFPEREVPLGNVRILMTADLGEGSFVVVTAYDGTVEAAIAEAVERLKDAGFEAYPAATGSGAARAALTNGVYVVGLIEFQNALRFYIDPK